MFDELGGIILVIFSGLTMVPGFSMLNSELIMWLFLELFGKWTDE
jgi:hypothetical protein